jgi:hypothetical protein
MQAQVTTYELRMTEMEKATLHPEMAEGLLELRKSQAQAIDRGYALYSSLLNELMLECDNAELFGELETLLDQSNFEIGSKIRMDKLMAIYHKVISLPGRVKAGNNLSKMFVILHRMESQALTANKIGAAGINRANDSLGKIAQKVRKGLDSISKPTPMNE